MSKHGKLTLEKKISCSSYGYYGALPTSGRIQDIRTECMIHVHALGGGGGGGGGTVYHKLNKIFMSEDIATWYACHVSDNLTVSRIKIKSTPRRNMTCNASVTQTLEHCIKHKQ